MKRPAGMKGRPPKAAHKDAKPISEAKVEPKVKVVKAEKKDAPCRKRKRKAADILEVPKSQIMKARPKMPSDGSNPLPVHYNGGVIYTSRSVAKFRALRKRGDKYSEYGAGWKVHGTQPAAWKAAVSSIDAYKKAGK